MSHFSIKTGGIKLCIGWLVVFALRLIPFRPPNVEPILATVMPFSKHYGVLGTAIFSFLSIALFDLVVGKIGIWTLVTAVAYTLVGVGAYFYFKGRSANRKNFLIYGIIGTLLYDALTGLTIGPIFYGQPFIAALVGQIPFTLAHLVGTAVLSVVVSPLLYKWVVTEERLEIPALVQRVQV